MVVSVTEFRKNLGKYLQMVGKEEVLIAKNGKIIAELSNYQTPHVDALKGILKGKVPADFDRDDLGEARLGKHSSN